MLRRFSFIGLLCLFVISLSACGLFEKTEEKDIYVGEYNSYSSHDPDLEIEKREDGCYLIQMGIYRITSMYDGVGELGENGIEFTITAFGSKTLEGIITLEDDVATVTFYNSEIADYIYSEYQYYKISDEPNINREELGFTGEYTAYEAAAPGLEIERQKDGSYLVQMEILDIATIYDGVGRVSETYYKIGYDGLTSEMSFTATIPDGSSVEGILREGWNSVTVIFLSQEWMDFSKGRGEFTYYKTSNVPRVWKKGLKRTNKTKSLPNKEVVDYQALGIKKYNYPSEFSLTDDLRTAITQMICTSGGFIADDVYDADWQEHFISCFVRNPELSFAYLDRIAEENGGEISVAELNYMQYSLTNTELDFSYLDRRNVSSGINYGEIADWDYEVTKEGVTLTVGFGLAPDGRSWKQKYKCVVKLVENPTSCFDGYSIVSLTSTPLKNQYEGEYCDYDTWSPVMEIAKTEKGNYVIWMKKGDVVLLDYVAGKKTKGGLEFTATQPDGTKQTGTITISEGGNATVTFSNREWALEAFGGDSYNFFKTSDAPDMEYDGIVKTVVEEEWPSEESKTKKHKDGSEFTLEDDLKYAIREMALSDNFTIEDVKAADWKDRFITKFIKNSRFSFAYLNEILKENKNKISIKELNYMQYSLTNTEVDFSYLNKDVPAYHAHFEYDGGWEYGEITDWRYKATEDGVVMIANVALRKKLTDMLTNRVYQIQLVKNPYSCFDGYSIASIVGIEEN